MKARKSKRSAKKLFDPDVIATEIHQALQRDLDKAQHEYAFSSSTERLLSSGRQGSELLSKYCSPDQDKVKLELNTFKKFLEVNEHMKIVDSKLSLPDPNLRIMSSTDFQTKVHLRARALMHFVLTPFDQDEWFDECRNSSGSSIGVPFSDTSIERKFTFPLSVTSRAKPMFQLYTLYDHKLWSEIESFNSQFPVTETYRVVTGSRATTVDKTTTKRRMICVEPTCNMFLQQGLMHMMYKRLKVVGLDVEFLPNEHKRRALNSSISRREATIDWSSASDCVSTGLLRWLLPAQWFSSIDITRSEFTSILGSDLRLNMISTMGNAVTFPLETLLFWTYAHAVRLSLLPGNSLFPEWEDLKTVSVFGDDCIVPSSIASVYVDVMKTVGFIINDDKSYYGSEQFRESCGGDYFAGYDVRPFYLKAPQSTKLSALEPWLYVIANSLIKKYISYFGVNNYVYNRDFFSLLSQYFLRYNLQLKVVPDYYPDDSGLKISQDILRWNLCYKWNFSLIAKSKHGTYCFSYLRFIYKSRYEQHGGIRLYSWLKRPIMSDNPPLHVNSIRKLGGYVVAKGISCHWYVPVVKREA